MKADAPGKLVLSGAYAVLRGAPALATAVSRRAVADTSRVADFSAPEVVAGLELLGGDHPAPFVDASPLRHEGRKLGLGSSAAICVASLGAVISETAHVQLDQPALQAAVYPLARAAHRNAQGGGSGIDIAASCFGGTIRATLDKDALAAPAHIEKVHLPRGLVFEVWASQKSAKTSDFVSRVFAEQAHQPARYALAFEAQMAASREAAQAAEEDRADSFIAALGHQLSALDTLGQLANIPIVLPEIRKLAVRFVNEGCVLPSGAGGGDVNLFVGRQPSSEDFRKAAQDAGLFPIGLTFGSEGLRVLGSGDFPPSEVL